MFRLFSYLLSIGVVMGANLDSAAAGRFASLALACVHREYPNKLAHLMNSDSDARAPRELTPAFYGCFDWHSSVHGHWLLARLARRFPDAPFAAEARAALARSLTSTNLSQEAAYLNGPGRDSFERPYGLAWLLTLAAELHAWDNPDAHNQSIWLRPLEDAAVLRISSWLKKLAYPVRSGEHSNTAFALGMMLDYARSSGRSDFAGLLERRIRDFYLKDRGCPLNYEPSGEDFLSPCLAEADAVRRVLPEGEFSRWLGTFLPEIPRDGSTRWLRPGVVTDPTDGKLAHLDGLNLSRAWMLYHVAGALPAADQRTAALKATAEDHARDGLKAVSGEHYEGGHWLGTFAVYLLTAANP